jgi:hypothetical protein
VTEEWKTAGASASQIATQIGDKTKERDEALAALAEVDKRGRNLVQSVEGRLLWPELLRAVNESLPTTPIPPDQSAQSIEAIQPDISKRRDLHITSFTATPMRREEAWYKGNVKRLWEHSQAGNAPAATEELPGEEVPPDAAADEEIEVDPALAGYRIEIKGHHFHNTDGSPEGIGGTYVQRTLIDKLLKGEIEVYSPIDGKLKKVRIYDQSMKDADGKDVGDRGLGVKYPVMTNMTSIKSVPNPAEGRENQQDFTQPGQLRRFDFTLEFWWRPATETDRILALERAAQAGEPDATATAAVTGTNEVQ